MYQATTDSSSRSGEMRFALLHLGKTRLLLPQHDIRLLDLLADMVKYRPPEHGVGWIAYQEQRVPVYALSEALIWQSEIAPHHAICVLLEAGGEYFGLLCTEVGIQPVQDTVFHDVPPVMRHPHAPFQRLAIAGDKLACVTSAALLKAYLPAVAASENLSVQEAL